jgi:glyoxylate reductase
MTVVYASRRPVTAPTGIAWNRRSLDEVLAQADFLSLHVPLTKSTQYLISARELAMMKPTAMLLNTSRGPVIDEAALVSALRTGKIAGAGLDVYEHEPAIHPELGAMHNVVLLPHLGSATQETRIRMGEACLNNIAAVLGGRPAPNQVRPV